MMEESTKSNLIPSQETGKAIDAESTAEFGREDDAKTFFSEVKSRLLNVNKWEEYAGELSANFQVIDKNGDEVQREARKGDYLKINIPGPGSKTGKGYDWVQIEEAESNITVDGEQFGILVRPTDNPQSKDKDVAHFYSKESTSTFIAERIKNKIRVSIHDRNTKPNMDADSTTDKVRDALVGAAGVLSFSKIQWQKLAEGLVKK